MSQREDIALLGSHRDPTIVFRRFVKVGPSTGQCVCVGSGADLGNAKIDQTSSFIRINEYIGLFSD
jgi:hypothetical protein